MSGQRRRLLQIKGWLHHIANAEPGAALQVGVHYDHGCGWRVYQAIGGKALALRPADALTFADVYDEMRRKVGPSALDDTLGRVRELAHDAARRNAAKEKPVATH